MSFLKTRLSFFVLFLLSGCAAGLHTGPGRYVEAPEPPTSLNISRSGDGLILLLKYIIDPGTPQVWLKDIKSREFCMDYTANRELYLEKVELLDVQGKYVPIEFPNIMMPVGDMMKQSQDRQMTSFGLNATGAVIGGLTGIPIGLATGLYTVLGAPQGHTNDAKEMERLQQEYSKRNLTLPTRLAKGAKIPGCHYFPPVNAKELVVTYKNSEYDQNPKQLRIFIEGHQNLVSTR